MRGKSIHDPPCQSLNQDLMHFFAKEKEIARQRMKEHPRKSGDCQFANVSLYSWERCPKRVLNCMQNSYSELTFSSGTPEQRLFA